jgi:hypothetical protein
MKGTTNVKLIEAIAYLHGRLELEIEYYCHHQGIDPLETTSFVGARLIGTPMDHVSAVLQAARAQHSAAPKVEVAHRAHGGRAQAAEKRTARQIATHKVAKGYWGKLSPEERSREMRRRMRKWKPEAKRNWKKKVSKQSQAKQAIYNARSRAKLAGEPIPPLPAKVA